LPVKDDSGTCQASQNFAYGKGGGTASKRGQKKDQGEKGNPQRLGASQRSIKGTFS